ncbi:MAG: carboxypeptidase-like regulatory domain-containing protein [Planctomycetota bacterium]
MATLALCLAMAAPLRAIAGPGLEPGATNAVPRVVDVAIAEDSLLYGQVVTAHGTPLAGAAVTLVGRDGKPVVARTNASGVFGYRGVKGGAYCLQAGDSVAVCRVWAPRTAPPKAARAVMLVADQRAVLGQHEAPASVNRFVGNSKRWLANPLVMAGVVGTAIAVPVAIANDDDPSS